MPKRWTEEEIKILRRNYKKGLKTLLELLPKRTKIGINKKLWRLGIRARFDLTPVNFKLTPFQKGYIVGLIEGEGTISINSAKTSRDRPYRRYRPSVRIANKNLDILKKVKKILKVGVIVKSKEIYQYKIVNIVKVKKLLETLYRYFIVKKEVARLVIKFCNLRMGKRHPYTNEELEIVKKVKEINTRSSSHIH